MAFATVGGFLRKVAGTGQGLGAVVVTTDSTDPLLVGSRATVADGMYGVPAIQPSTTVRKVCDFNADRVRCSIVNAGSVTVYLGYDNTVTTSTGTPLLPNQSATETETQSEIWGITASGTADIRIMEV